MVREYTVLILKVRVMEDQYSKCDYYLPDTARLLIFTSPESWVLKKKC